MRISDWSSDVCSSDLNISIGGSVYRRDLNSFNFIDNDRRTTFEQVTTGAQINVGVPLTEFMSFFGRYSINLDDVTLNKGIYYFGDECDPLVAGRYLCDAIGNRTTSLLGYTLAYDDRDKIGRSSCREGVCQYV